MTLPSGLTTTYEIAFRHEITEIANLSLQFYVDREGHGYDLTNISVE